MNLRKVECYDAGYGEASSNGTLKKAVAATAAAAVMVGGLTGCFPQSVSGNMEYQPPEYDGDIAVESVPESDPSSEEEWSIMGEEEYFPVASEEEALTLDGDVAYVP